MRKFSVTSGTCTTMTVSSKLFRNVVTEQQNRMDFIQMNIDRG